MHCSSPRRLHFIAAAIAPLLLSSFALASAADTKSVSKIESVARSSMVENHLKAVIVQVRSNGSNVYTGAFGDSMTGVPATPEMHFRNGALAFTYMATLLLEFVDRKEGDARHETEHVLSRSPQRRPYHP